MATDNKPVVIIRADADGIYHWHDLDTGERGVLTDGECLDWPPGSSAPLRMGSPFLNGADRQFIIGLHGLINRADLPRLVSQDRVESELDLPLGTLPRRMARAFGVEVAPTEFEYDLDHIARQCWRTFGLQSWRIKPEASAI